MKLSTVSRVLLIIMAAGVLSACSQWQGWHPGQYPEGQMPPGHEAQAYSPYRKMDRRPPDVAKKRKSCVTVNGHEVCGYDCKTSGGQTKCAKEPKERCVVGPNGHIACGYHCKKTQNGAKCGKYLYDNCATNGYGEIKCGNNCREREDGELVCGK